MELFITIIVCLLAGCGAGLGTGFAGMSAAVVITPMLVTFLDMPAYSAIGIALASDVLASGVSAYTYHKNKNIDIKNGIVMMLAVLLFTFVGSFVASFVPNDAMGGTSVFMTTLMGIKFIVKPVNTTKEAMNAVSPKKRLVQSIIFGMLIGFICGFVGAGGGMMMLMILTMVLGYELKTAVGTSVFIMTFTALTGAVSHFVIDSNTPDLLVLILCVLFTLIFARIGAVIANKVSSKTLNRATGIILVTLGVIVIGVGALV
ncbi:MAG: sulfite exporter TauE/SafE family protein [Oscillospiraceae bacterium]|nr:sulfite exporter TauE/SafE family protein [Oscillospiraceae bacterium]MBQ8906262.1 sulfite exporter TauE/SafE family protein [Ruminococcus sp.]